jgi:hypothetical protein
MRVVSAIAVLLVPIYSFAAPVNFKWVAPSSTNITGYYLDLRSGTNYQRYDSETNLQYTADVPPGTWFASTKAYSTNNSSTVRIEGRPSNEVIFYVPRSPSLEVAVDYTYRPPVLLLTSNSVMRVTVFLQKAGIVLPGGWSAGVPIFECDVGDGTNAFYRTYLKSRLLP